MSSDPFFVTPKFKKRKPVTFEDVSSNGKRIKTQNGRNIQTKEKIKPNSLLKNKNGNKIQSKLEQEESEDDIGPGGIDDMDFNGDSDTEETSDDNGETPTEKRRRLAKQYIESVKERIGKNANLNHH